MSVGGVRNWYTRTLIVLKFDFVWNSTQHIYFPHIILLFKLNFDQQKSVHYCRNMRNFGYNEKSRFENK